VIPSGGRGRPQPLPLLYLVPAAAAFVLAVPGVAWLSADFAGHWYHPRLLALTHTVTLGWITLAIMGASYHLIPIVLQRPIWSERLARWQLAALVTGIVGMVAHFFIGRWHGLVWGAFLVLLGSAAHVLNVGRTLVGLRPWTFTARMMAAALVGFALTALFGLALGIEHMHAFLGGDVHGRLAAHVHLALLGWVLPMIVGVAAHVYPMLLVAADTGRRLRSLQLFCLGVGVPLVVVGLLGAGRLAAVGALATAVGVTAHIAWVVRITAARRRPTLDWSLRLVLAGTAFLAPASLLGLALVFDRLRGPRWALAYAVVALGGGASLTIAGMMLKIVPFLVWNRAYAPMVARGHAPSLAELSWPAAEALAFAGLTLGTVVLTIAVAVGAPALIRDAGIVLAVGAAGFAAGLARVLHHLVPCPLRNTVTAP
jgi:hypothetical protein